MTAYRNESDALRARVVDLERELSAERANVARLKGVHARTDGRAPDSLVGAVVHQADVQVIPGKLSAETLERLARLVRDRLALEVTSDGGRISARATGLAAADGPKTFSLASVPGGTELRLETDVRRLPLAVVLSPIAGLLTTLPVVLWQMQRFHHFEPGWSLGAILGLVAAAMIAGTIVTRMLAKQRALRVREAHDGVWATVLEICRDAPTRVRVAEAGTEPATTEPAEVDVPERVSVTARKRS